MLSILVRRFSPFGSLALPTLGFNSPVRRFAY
jgi:hypothetical protein